MFDKLHEECGVFGIVGHPEAVESGVPGAVPRCSTAARRAPASPRPTGEAPPCTGRWGTSPTRSARRCSRACQGQPAVGHVRYSTAGDSDHLNAQPILIDCQHGQIALCHNGNLVNAAELRDELVRDGAIFQTSSDSEVILHLYARSQGAPRGGRDHRVARAGARRVLARAARRTG